MTKKSGNKSVKKSDQKASSTQELKGTAWIPFRWGIIIIAILSVGMAGLTIYQAIALAGKPVGEAVLWGLVYGGMLWVIFFGFILLNQLLGRNK